MKEELKETSATTEKDISRRRFLTFAGLAGAGLAVGLASCSKDDDDDDNPKPGTGDENTVDLGSEDFGLLNHLYAVKQLTAAFYLRATKPFYTNAPTAETEFLPDVRDHHIAHREVLRNLLGDKAIAPMDFYLDNKINFADRWNTLSTAVELEEMNISAFLGVAGLFASAEYLLLTSKMASVHGRHVGYLRDLMTYNTFSAGVDNNGLDLEKTPAEVIAALAKYYPKTITAKRLPKF